MKLLSLLIQCILAGRKKPNVVILLCDDLGLGDIGIYNSKSKIKTPNLNKIAKQGFRFYDAHSASSKCGPSRYSLMTGRYSLEKLKDRKMHPHQPHLGQMFKKSGYFTGIVGKHQPIAEEYLATDYTEEELKYFHKQKREYKKRVYTTGDISGKRTTHEDKYSHVF